jgi:hypothetical protein
MYELTMEGNLSYHAAAEVGFQPQTRANSIPSSSLNCITGLYYNQLEVSQDGFPYVLPPKENMFVLKEGRSGRSDDQNAQIHQLRHLRYSGLRHGIPKPGRNWGLSIQG